MSGAASCTEVSHAEALSRRARQRIFNEVSPGQRSEKLPAVLCASASSRETAVFRYDSHRRRVILCV